MCVFSSMESFLGMRMCASFELSSRQLAYDTAVAYRTRPLELHALRYGNTIASSVATFVFITLFEIRSVASKHCCLSSRKCSVMENDDHYSHCVRISFCIFCTLQWRLYTASTLAMDFLNEPSNLLTFTMWFITLILDASDSVPLLDVVDADELQCSLLRMSNFFNDSPVFSQLSLMANNLQQYCLFDPPFPVSNEIQYWIKPRSTT